MNSRGKRLLSWKKRIRRESAELEGKMGVTGMITGAGIDENSAKNPQRILDDAGFEFGGERGVLAGEAREEVTQVVGDDGVVHGGKFPLAVGEWRDQIAVDV